MFNLISIEYYVDAIDMINLLVVFDDFIHNSEDCIIGHCINVKGQSDRSVDDFSRIEMLIAEERYNNQWHCVMHSFL